MIERNNNPSHRDRLSGKNFMFKWWNLSHQLALYWLLVKENAQLSCFDPPPALSFSQMIKLAQVVAGITVTFTSLSIFCFLFQSSKTHFHWPHFIRLNYFMQNALVNRTNWKVIRIQTSPHSLWHVFVHSTFSHHFYHHCLRFAILSFCIYFFTHFAMQW